MHQSITDLLTHFNECAKCQNRPGEFCKVGSQLMETIDNATHLITRQWLNKLGPPSEGQRYLLNKWCGGPDWLNKSIPIQPANLIEFLTTGEMKK